MCAEKLTSELKGLAFAVLAAEEKANRWDRVNAEYKRLLNERFCFIKLLWFQAKNLHISSYCLLSPADQMFGIMHWDISTHFSSFMKIHLHKKRTAFLTSPLQAFLIDH